MAAQPRSASHSDGDWNASGRRAGKSAAAFRTISEVSTDLDVPQHVLRFWETKFPQVRPLKRAGGRRYYRPEDVGLLRSIRDLLYRDGYTIKGAQKLLRETGQRQRAAEAPSAPAAAAGEAPRPAAEPQPLVGRPVAAARAAGEAATSASSAGSGTGVGGAGRSDKGGTVTISRAELEALLKELSALRALLR